MTHVEPWPASYCQPPRPSITEMHESVLWTLRGKHDRPIRSVLARMRTANTFLGLTDIGAESQFVWANEEPLSDEQDNYIWITGQPDNAVGDEDCTEVTHGTCTSVFGISDVNCGHEKYYKCEPF